MENCGPPSAEGAAYAPGPGDVLSCGGSRGRSLNLQAGLCRRWVAESFGSFAKPPGSTDTKEVLIQELSGRFVKAGIPTCLAHGTRWRAAKVES
mmetsp:Transcript_11218/g.26951  ORF Transcript_11218/g.26951 Transcript_11218/m.26951 type:complete len:94 (+) Transcript_11218:109-390(+)